MDVAALDAVDGKLYKPVIDQDDRTGRNDIGQTLARLGDHTIAALDARLGERERVARHKLHRLMACQLARADLGAFGIEQDGAGAVQMCIRDRSFLQMWIWRLPKHARLRPNAPTPSIHAPGCIHKSPDATGYYTILNVRFQEKPA